MNKRSVLFAVVIVSSLSLCAEAVAQLYTQADKETLSTSEIVAAKNKFQIAKTICYEKAIKVKVKNPVDVKKAQTNLYIVCMKSRNYNVSELPEPK